MELEDTTVEIDEERVRHLHEDCEVNGDVEKFVADYKYLIWRCQSNARASEQRFIEPPSKWGKKIDRLYMLMYQ
ncbi:MAG: hypothetical protein P8J17_07975, partial [Halioglobus sp.]|nr:hypothetical protein [Halioglobus sp.]